MKHLQIGKASVELHVVGEGERPPALIVHGIQIRNNSLPLLIKIKLFEKRNGN